MRRSGLWIVAAFVLVAHPLAWAEALRSVELQFDGERQSVARGLNSTAAQRVRLVSSARIDGGLPQQRSSEVSEQHLLLIAIDEDGLEIHRRLVIDPRLQRRETLDAAGKLHADPPDLVSIARIRVAVPGQTGQLRLLSPRHGSEGIEWDELGRVELPR